MKGIKKWLHNSIGRKLFITLATAVFTYINSRLSNPVPPDVIKWIIGIAVSYLFVQAGSDVAGKIRDGKIGTITS